MSMVLPVVVVVAYLALLTFVAIRARAALEFEEFSLAKRALPLALVFGSLAATLVGPVYTIGFVGRGFKSGFLFLVIGLAYLAQNILVGFFVAPRLRSLENCHTLGDAIEQKYDRKCQIVAGIISVGLCVGFSAVMAKAGGDVLNKVLHLPNWSSVAIIVGITALYTTFGGLRASVITDAFQFTAFATLLPVTLILALIFHLNGGAAAFTAQATTATVNGFKETPVIEIIGLLVAFFLGETLIPPYANRALASKSTHISRNGFILAGIFSIIWFLVMISLGITARIMPDIPMDTDGNRVLLSLFRTVMPTSGYALLLVVLVSVIMSSLDSLLNAGAVAFTQDIVKPFIRLPNGTALNIGRTATIVIAITAAICALAVQDIINGLLTCYAIWSTTVLPALILGLWIKHPRPLAGILSMGAGAAVSVALWILFVFDLGWEVDVCLPRVIIPGLASSLIAYFLGHSFGSIKHGA
ncbi:MAG: sodium:solute symporter family protein [Sedimentisphaerales bacterium]|nr:sodium:solute symporter family protein [Sedimentisphaerales bacterium]